jgi:tetratricopeptide (TPR) repeat protein
MHRYFRYLIVINALALSACGQDPVPAAPKVVTAPQFVGSEACADCHVDQFADWTDSHHDLAMQIADESTVLGDFEQSSFEYFGSTTEFFKEGGKFVIRTANANGKNEDYVVTHTFGITPLQQYLVEFPGGRLQSVPFAWDSRLATAGGQRWFHVYGDEFIAPDDELHWTGRQQNWNYMCAECHSTNLNVNYDQGTDIFATTWSEMNVGCEGCHGPASRHVAEAQSGEFSSRKGLRVDLDDHGRAVWQMNVHTGIAERSEFAMRQSKQPEACGRCHSRRGVISTEYEYGVPLTETHRPALLNSPLYFDDGQIRDEVYVYGSFLQSRMYQAGVTCSDCHNPHSLQLVTGAEPSDVCTQCHLPSKFAATEHHQHAPAEVVCVDCHMPTRDYMQVDPRRDHSFKVPRPDLSASSNTPNACASCHADRDSDWLAQAAGNWWGDVEPHFASTFAAARSGAGNAGLNDVVADRDLPGIVRATALAAMSGPPGEAEVASIEDGLGDPDPLVRMAATGTAQILPPETQLQLLSPLLKDPSRSVRIEAARTLAPLREYTSANSGFAAAAREYRAAQLAVASRPEAHVALGDFESSMGNPDKALEHYSIALAMDPKFSFARLNYADALRRFGDEPGAEKMLRDGLDMDAANADLRHSLGLLLVRTERSDEGLKELQLATELAPDNARFAYVAGIALHSLGQTDNALRLLSEAHERFTGDFDIAWALATMLRDSGDTAGARIVAGELAAQRPDDANVKALLASLNAA